MLIAAAFPYSPEILYVAANQHYLAPTAHTRRSALLFVFFALSLSQSICSVGKGLSEMCL